MKGKNHCVVEKKIAVEEKCVGNNTIISQLAIHGLFECGLITT